MFGHEYPVYKMSKFEEKAWTLYCSETAGDMDVKDFWQELSPAVQLFYLEAANERDSEIFLD